MADRRTFLSAGAKVGALAGATQLGSGIARAEPGKLIPGMCPWTLRSSEAFEIDSWSVGDRMAVGIWSNVGSVRQRSDKAETPLDVVYVLDGAFVLPAAAMACRLMTADLIHPGFTPVLLVGVDYPTEESNARTRDYTMPDSVPPNLAMALQARAPLSPRTTPGGAENFLNFLENELNPLIRSKYHTSDRPAGILADSFGATFAFYAFIRQSRLFDRYWMGSPGIFTTETDYVSKFEECLESGLVHPTKMFLSLGSEEASAGVDFYEDLGRNYNRMVSALRRHPSDRLTWSYRVYDGHTHTSVFLPALNDAILYLLR